jgi:putative ABC transport system ATP-binding protein
MTEPVLISLTGIQKVFFTEEIETNALDDIHLDIQEGEYVAINGPSGCGKSTLLSIIGLLHMPTQGEYQLDGMDVSSIKPSQQAYIRNRRIGFIFQAFNLIGDMNVFENVELPLTYRKELDKKDRNAMVIEALDKVEMSHRANHYPAQLSGGQQQRVAIARALGGEPKVLLADEPTGNLDSRNAAIVMNLLEDLNRAGCTICIVTHDQSSAQRADRQVTLFDGKIVDDQATSRIRIGSKE